MSITVLALDLDVTKAGVALPTGRTLTLTAPKVGKRHATHGQRLRWWHRELDALVRFYRPTVVAVEAPIPTPGRETNERKAGVHAIAEMVAAEWGAHWAPPVYPSHLKLAMAGHGGAEKADMLAAAIARGAAPANDDEADAALVRFYTLEILDGPEALRRWLGV